MRAGDADVTPGETAADAYRIAFERAPVALGLVDADGRWLCVNPALSRLLGRSSATLEGREVEEAVPPEGRPALRAALANPGGPLARTEHPLLGVAGGLRASLAVADAGDGAVVVEVAVLPNGAAAARPDAGPRDGHAAASAGLDRVTADIGHDLRAPLSAAMGYAELLDETQAERLTPAGREWLRRIMEAGRRMDSLISGVVLYSRARYGALADAPVALGDVVEEVRERVAGLLAISGGRLDAGPLPTVRGDRALLVEAVAALVDNGLRFNQRPDPLVRVTAATDGAAHHLRIHDNGIGIPADRAGAAFELGRRLRPDDLRAGAGVGLAVARAVVERHGGRIWMEPGADRGTCVHVLLPA